MTFDTWSDSIDFSKAAAISASFSFTFVSKIVTWYKNKTYNALANNAEIKKPCVTVQYLPLERTEHTTAGRHNVRVFASLLTTHKHDL